MSEATSSLSWLGRLIPARPGEWRALALSFGYFFFVLATYYVLRPVRDEMGVRSGLKNLPWLFTGTFVTSLILAPIYAALVAKLRRSRLIPTVYGFLILNIVAFWIGLEGGFAPAVVAATFFVWLSVFNVFAVSVFWTFMADLFANEQAKRLYPTIAAGGSLGGFAGSATVTGLVRLVGPANLLLIAAVLLTVGLACAMALEKAARGAEEARLEQRKAGEGEAKVGGGWLDGLKTLVASPYLGGIGLWVFILSLVGTFAYYMQADIVGSSGLDSAGRTQIFGMVDLSANILAPLVQILITRHLIQRLGVGPTLGVVCLVFTVGFLAMAAAPILSVLVIFMVAQRTGQFAISNPAREALWPVVDRDEKYKAKNVIDNAVFRGGDVANSWIFNLLHTGMGLGLSAIALIGAPLAGAWFVLSLLLGRAQERRAGEASNRTVELKEATP